MPRKKHSSRIYREPDRGAPRGPGALHATRLCLLSSGALIVVGTVGFLPLPGLYAEEGLRPVERGG